MPQPLSSQVSNPFLVQSLSPVHPPLNSAPSSLRPDNLVQHRSPNSSHSHLQIHQLGLNLFDAQSCLLTLSPTSSNVEIPSHLHTYRRIRRFESLPYSIPPTCPLPNPTTPTLRAHHLHQKLLLNEHSIVLTTYNTYAHSFLMRNAFGSICYSFSCTYVPLGFRQPITLLRSYLCFSLSPTLSSEYNKLPRLALILRVYV